ncbi:hypothetical protein AB0E82_39540 [Streptomyces anulatus]|uniref:hypothetical protein n=1 Tax=Streptomyces anulatus TaxID=1892 RepID=UPI0033D7CC5D
MQQQKMDSREGFSKSDCVRWAEGEPSDLPADGVVNGWSTVQYEPDKWYCSVTWGGRYTGQHQSRDIRHA